MGDEDERLRDFCSAEYPRLVGALRLSCGYDAGLAEEFAQEALARLCRDWARLSEDPRTRGWVYRVAFNLVRSHWRRQKVRRRVEARLVGEEAVTDHAGAVAIRDQVDRSLTRLSARERRVVVLRHFLDLPVNDTAIALGVSGQAVRSLDHRALRKLRLVLADEPVKPGHAV